MKKIIVQLKNGKTTTVEVRDPRDHYAIYRNLRMLGYSKESIEGFKIIDNIMKAKLVKESLDSLLNESAIRLLWDKKIAELGKELGYKINDGRLGLNLSKRIKGGELNIWITVRHSPEKLRNHEWPTADDNILMFSATWYPEKKVLGKFRRPHYSYEREKTIYDNKKIDFGKGLFSMSDSEILKKIEDKLKDCENRV